MRHNCGKNGHVFSAPSGAGGGLLRTICSMCGWVSIDLSPELAVLRPLVWINRNAKGARAETDLLVSGAASS